jgi:hypothetical protein
MKSKRQTVKGETTRSRKKTKETTVERDDVMYEKEQIADRREERHKENQKKTKREKYTEENYYT